MTDPIDPLARAGLATHLACLAEGSDVAEADLLGALLEAVPGLLFRTGPGAYAFDASDIEDADEAVPGALAAVLGTGTTRVSRIGTQAGAPPAEEAEADRALVLLRAMAGSAGTAVEAETPGLRAVVDAEFAVRAARLTAEGLTALAIAPERADEIEARLGQIERALVGVERSAEALLDRPGRAEPPEALSNRLEQIERSLAGVERQAEAILAGQDGSGEVSDTLSARLGQIERSLEGVERCAAILLARPAGTEQPESLTTRLEHIERSLAGVERCSEALLARAEDPCDSQPLGAVATRLEAIETTCATAAARLEEIAGSNPAANAEEGIARIERRLDAVDAQLTRLRGIAGGTSPDLVDMLGRISTAFAGVLRRLDAQVGVLEEATQRLASTEEELAAAGGNQCDATPSMPEHELAGLREALEGLETRLRPSDDQPIRLMLAELLARAQRQAVEG